MRCVGLSGKRGTISGEVKEQIFGRKVATMLVVGQLFNTLCSCLSLEFSTPRFCPYDSGVPKSDKHMQPRVQLSLKGVPQCSGLLLSAPRFVLVQVYRCGEKRGSLKRIQGWRIPLASLQIHSPPCFAGCDAIVVSVSHV